MNESRRGIPFITITYTQSGFVDVVRSFLIDKLKDFNIRAIESELKDRFLVSLLVKSHPWLKLILTVDIFSTLTQHIF